LDRALARRAEAGNADDNYADKFFDDGPHADQNAFVDHVASATEPCGNSDFDDGRDACEDTETHQYAYDHAFANRPLDLSQEADGQQREYEVGDDVDDRHTDRAGRLRSSAPTRSRYGTDKIPCLV
jgi:hypothetical protein